MFAAIETIQQNCRRCYTCVRSCPVKAIRIVDGQASVVDERCIACGRCTTVCSQNAKTCVSGVEQTLSLLNSDEPVAALLAPSFPAEFPEVNAEQVVGGLRRAGFRFVVEVASGGDHVAAAYREWLDLHPECSWIATACPAIVERVRKYHPDLVPQLAPIVSPMIATAHLVRKRFGANVRCVFIGPCVAKKLEVRDPLLPRVVDEALTFGEMRRIFDRLAVSLPGVEPSPFDPPTPLTGRPFPLEGGLLLSASLRVEVLANQFIVAAGRRQTQEALADLESNGMAPSLVEALMCHGCHEGPGMSHGEHQHRRRIDVCDHAVKVASQSAPMRLAPDQLERRFTADDQRFAAPGEAEVRAVLARTNKFTTEDELNCGACGYATCRAKATAVLHGIAEETMCLPFVIDQAERVCHELHVPWRDLREIHRQLVSTEKLASLGQLAAGIAHELNNPLGTILLYTGLIERKLGQSPLVAPDLRLVQEETQRCKRIVGGLLDFARQNRTQFNCCQLQEFISEVLHKSFDKDLLAQAGTHLVFEAPSGDIAADIDRDQMTQVLVNLVRNGIEALGEQGGRVTIHLDTVPQRDRVLLIVRDTGCGIPPQDHERVFQPFFTTKSLGRGTGLGLPIAYGIVKMHRGTIWFESSVGLGTAFFIELPVSQARQTRSLSS